MNKKKLVGKKPTKLPVPINTIPTSIQNSSFELELCWCIQQLQTSLDSGKLSEREAERISKAINTLKSPKEIFIKKRQLMQQLLGDYRDKMKKEEKKHSVDPKKIKFVDVKPNKKSCFVKKAVLEDKCGNNFKFNFPVEELDSLDIAGAAAMPEKPIAVAGCSKAAISPTSETVSEEKFHFVPSGNSFRFAFNVDEESAD